MTFVIDNLVLKLCEPRFKLRTSWKKHVGDVLREERFLSCKQHFMKIKPLIRETLMSYLVSLESGILVPTNVEVLKASKLVMDLTIVQFNSQALCIISGSMCFCGKLLNCSCFI